MKDRLKKRYIWGFSFFYLINNEMIYKIIRSFLNSRLRQILVHITNKCNYDCAYCYVNKETRPLALEDWIGLLRQARRLGIKRVGILGGEPLCEPQLLERLFLEIEKLGMDSCIYTNGSLLSEGWIEKYKRYNPVVIVKYDLDNQVYQKVTRQKEHSLEDIEQRIKLCVKKGLRVMTFTALLRDNYRGVKKIFSNSIAIGALPAFERYLPVREEELNRLLEINDQEYLLSMSELKDCYEHFFLKLVKVAARITGRSCGCYSNLVSVSADGEILPCPYLPRSASLGNIRSVPLKEALSAYKRQFTDRHISDDKCSQCKDRIECGGGCLTYAYLKKGDFFSNCANKDSLGLCSYHLVSLLGKKQVLGDTPILQKNE